MHADPLPSICWSLWSLHPITGALTAASVSTTLQSYLTPEPDQQHAGNKKTPTFFFLFKCLKCAFSLWVQKKSANLAVKSWNARKPAYKQKHCVGLVHSWYCCCANYVNLTMFSLFHNVWVCPKVHHVYKWSDELLSNWVGLCVNDFIVLM